MSLRAEIVTEAAKLEAMVPDWWQLWRRCPPATPFQTPAWDLAWWRSFSPGDLAAIAVSLDDRLVALAPLYLERGGAAAKLLPIGISLSDYLDVLVDPAWEKDAIHLMAETAHALRWERWDMEELGVDAAALRLPLPCVDETARASACPVLVLRGGTDLSGCVPARRRRQLRRARAAAARRGTLTIEAAASNPDGFLDHLFRLHEARWAQLGEPGIVGDERVRSFHRRALPALAKAGLARCYLLRIGGRVVGAYYGLLDRASAYAYLGGFDPDYSGESPGSILIGHAMAEAIGEQASEFHFLRGREAYKYSWGAADRWNQRRSYTRDVP